MWYIRISAMVKNLHKIQEQPRKPASSRRSNKTFRDAKLACLGIPCDREANNFFCKVCKDGGSLVLCSNCTRSYHLQCAHLKEKDLPVGPWVCTFCFPTIDKKFREEAAKLEKTQKSSKELEIRTCLNSLNSNLKARAVRDLEKNFPQYVRSGKIVYPIEDKLLENNPELHQVSQPKKIPSPFPLPVPGHFASDLLYITDFVYNFESVLKLSHFTVEQLYSSLQSKEETSLLKELHMALICELIEVVMASDLDSLGSVCKFLHSLYVLKDTFDISEFLPYSWLALLQELLRVKTFREYSEDTVVQKVNQKTEDRDLETCYFSLSYKEKVGILVFLVNCCFESKNIHEELVRRVEEKSQLNKEKANYYSEAKALEQKLKDENKSQSMTRKAQSTQEKTKKLYTQIEDLNRKIESIQLRTLPLGLDRDLNEYYFFQFDSSKVYVKTSNSSRKTNPNWYAFYKQSDIDHLLSVLYSKGVRESKLIEGLKWAKPKLVDSEESSTSSEQTEEPKPYTNKFSEFEPVHNDLDSVKKILLDVEKSFTEYLEEGNKHWEKPEVIQNWRKGLKKTKDPSQVAKYLLEHAEKASTPLRKAMNVSESESEEETPKYRKVVLKVWQDLGEFYKIWEELVKSVATNQQLALAIGIYHCVLNNYAEKRPETKKPEPEPKQEKSSRSMRYENRKKKIKEEQLHDDHCFLCDDGGSLICCEMCPTVVHPKCIGLKRVPNEDWYCDKCKKSQVPRTRQRTRLHRHNA